MGRRGKVLAGTYHLTTTATAGREHSCAVTVTPALVKR
jgi:hypothetical protein